MYRSPFCEYHEILSSGAAIDESKITKVTSNKDYITASESDGKWTITADPNTTDDVSEGATMTITYDGNDYTINVKYTKTDTKATDGTTDAWIKNFNYTTSGSTVTLKKFTGDVTSISIYSTVTIEGTKYTSVKVASGLFSASKSTTASKLTEVNFVGSSTKSVGADSSLMSFFFSCTSLKKVDLSGLDTSNVTNMTSFFNGCTDLTNDGTDSYIKFKNGDISYFTTKSVINMSSMFYGSGIKKLDLSSFDTTKLTEMGAMFGSCSSLEEVNLSSFSGAISVNYASYDNSFFYPFNECSNLSKITLGSNWQKADSKTYLKLGLSGYWKNTGSLPIPV